MTIHSDECNRKQNQHNFRDKILTKRDQRHKEDLYSIAKEDWEHHSLAWWAEHITMDQLPTKLLLGILLSYQTIQIKIWPNIRFTMQCICYASWKVVTDRLFIMHGMIIFINIFKRSISAWKKSRNELEIQEVTSTYWYQSLFWQYNVLTAVNFS